MTFGAGLGFAVLCAALAFVLRECKSPLTPFVSILGGIALLLGTLSRVADGEIISKLSSLFQGEDTKIVFKVLAIGLLTEVCADTCEELGSPTVAKRLVFFGNVEILFVTLPTLSELFSLTEDLLL